MSQKIEIRKAKDRFHTQTKWLTSFHSFSFAEHFDPANTHHGLLRVSNDDVVKAGTGFPMHHHRDMEIITWVLSGELEHQDSQGNHGIIYPGLAQRMSAGSGIMHSEVNPSPTQDVRLIQMWVFPDQANVPPGYQQMDIRKELEGGGLVPLASGQKKNAALSIHQKDATLWVGRLKANERIRIPEAPFVHVFIATGEATLGNSESLEIGDAARLKNVKDLHLLAHQPQTEVLIWQMNVEKTGRS